MLRSGGVECEHADKDAVVLMLSSESTADDCRRVLSALPTHTPAPLPRCDTAPRPGSFFCSIRQALFAPSEVVDVADSDGRICASPAVTCPPAIPIAVPGEIISEQSAALFARYGIDTVRVLKRPAISE